MAFRAVPLSPGLILKFYGSIFVAMFSGVRWEPGVSRVLKIIEGSHLFGKVFADFQVFLDIHVGKNHL